MVRLASVEFTKLKNVRPGTRLTFSEAGAVLLGMNGTGKTTLLNYLVALCTADTNAFVSDEPFDVAAQFSWPTGVMASLRISGAPVSPFSSSEPPQGIAQHLPSIENVRSQFQITLPSVQDKYTIIIADGRVELFRVNEALCTAFPASNTYSLPLALWKLAELLSSANPSKWMDHPATAIGLDLMRLQTTLHRYDEGLDYFKTITEENHTNFAFELAAFRASPPRAMARRDVYKLPFDLDNALKLGLSNTPNPESLSATHTTVSFLNKFCQLCNFSGATVIAPIDSRRDTANIVTYSSRSLRFMFEVGTNRISHASLSFGQKRLLSYLYYISCNIYIAIADELVNGMHHQWIDYCLGEACADRQMFYTSQNPLLLDFLVFESEAQVSERFVTCRWTEQDGFIWENLEPRVGEEFYRLYRTGIQHVSDILRTKGWW
jgi:hypothetical protein